MPLLQDSDAMYRLLIQSVVDYAIYMLTPEGIVANWNPGAQRAKGYTAVEIVGQHFSLFYSEDERRADLPGQNLRIARTEGRFEAQGWRLKKDGSAFWAHVIIDAVRNDAGDLLGFAKITRDCTEQHQALQVQREHERRFRLLVQGVSDYAIYMLDLDGNVVNWNAGAQRAKGYQEHEIVGQHFSVFYTPEDRALGLPSKGLETARREGRFEAEGIRQRKDGSHFWTHVVIDAIHDDDGEMIGFAKITRDITERRKTELQLLEAKELAEKRSAEMATLSRFLDSVIANIPASVIVQDVRSHKILLVNQQAERLFAATKMVGRFASECLRPEVADYINQQMNQTLSMGEVRTSEMQVHTAQGLRTLRSRTVLNQDTESHSDYVLFVAEDVTDELAANAKIHHMAHHDALTGLPNRTLFQQRLKEALARSNGPTGSGKITGTLCLDLDDFKDVNDALGHAFGDKLLRALSERLRSELRDRDTLARLGGDEFAVILPELDTQEAAELAAQRMIQAIRPPFLIDGHSCSVGVSVGIALSPEDHVKPEQLMGYADMALYEAKRNGRNRFERFRQELDEIARQRRTLEADLRTALHFGQLKMHYQPIVSRDGQDISGYEALIRWIHPIKGIIPPMDFIPMAEETGLIHEVGTRALNLACQEAAGWGTLQTVSVNLSPIQFKNPGLIAIVELALADSGLAPERLELEITESVLLGDSDENVSTLRALKALGVAISLDDFGTGYSSLGYLRSFPFDRIKIDRSFVKDMAENKEALAIIRAITGMGNSLLIETTAEGVETHEQMLQLQAEGCSHFQGFFFGRPVPADERLITLKDDL
ncbi:EAL domain-containing protein [Pseudomonas sp. NPDC088368]|jgi:diguanylate cyclase (GGDEF)-like protein/PAS domain S-box-containing protein|uniref:sensor domain-containing protein n=1 Tax=Pseudomonas sp. NPDC088368 TaxID=3364453 RepID=UPI00382E3D39